MFIFNHLLSLVQNIPALHLARPQLQAPGQMPDPRQQLLQQMADVISPEGVNWWPPAIGWWVVFFLAVTLVTLLIYTLIQRYKRQRYRKLAKRLIHSIYTQDDMPAQQRAIQIMLTLKRIFFTAYPEKRNQVAGIYGSDWFELLDSSLAKPYKKVDDSDAFKHQLDQALYRDAYAHVDDVLEKLKGFSDFWVSQHRSVFKEKTIEQPVNEEQDPEVHNA
ncbi:MAG: DUF4381 domain-containing protein [Agarilytica sp.]